MAPPNLFAAFAHFLKKFGSQQETATRLRIPFRPLKPKSQVISAFAALNANGLHTLPFKNNLRESQSATAPPCSHVQPHTCVHNSLYLDARVVQLLGKGVHSLQQVLAGLRVNVGPPCWNLDWTQKQTV